jgi:hypothetical protein
MAKFIGVKMIEAVPMTAREANDKGYRIGNHSFEEDGYEVTYPDGYKSWTHLGFVLQWAKYGLKK